MNSTVDYTLASMLQANALNLGAEVAWNFHGKTVSHAEFLDRASRLASAWSKHGLRSQDRVAVMSRNNLEIAEIFAASELSGIITATVSFRFVGPEILHILNDSSPKVLIFEEEFAGVIDTIRSSLTSTIDHFVCIGTAPDWAISYEQLISSGEAVLPLPPKPTDTAYIIYTSGTTGRPKGVMLSHEAKVRSAQAINALMAAGSHDRILLMMPMFHVGAKDMQMGHHWRGGTVYLHREFDPELILQTIQDEQITITHMAPTMIQMLLDHPRIKSFDLSSLRMIVYSAAAMPIALLRRGLEILGPVFLQMYGQTEGAGTILPLEAHRPDGDERDQRRLQSIGIPFPGVQVRIVDELENDRPTGEAGEILLGGPIVMKGYWNNSSATIETLRGGWLHTGDVGKLDEDGYLYLVDRKKDMIVSGGENIYSREVEEALYKHEAVANAAVIGVSDEKWGEAVRAVVQLRSGAAATDKEIIAHCRTVIAGYKCPKSVVFTDVLPTLPSGKINKIEIRKNFSNV
jgi:acyl-CoA synthetase (AMP-forming)/AMP-acid ligase II